MREKDGVRWYGRDHNHRENEANCIEEIWGDKGWTQHQCSRRRGHGSDGLYCKQHDPDRIKKKREAENKEYELKQAARMRNENRRKLERDFCKPFTSAELEAGINAREELEA